MMRILRQLGLLASLLGSISSEDALAAPTQQVGPAPAVPAASGGFSNPTVSPATLFTPPAGATWCVFYFETAPIRWRDDGTAPTSSVGMPQNPGDSLVYKFGPSGSTLQFIQQSSGAVIDASCYQ